MDETEASPVLFFKTNDTKIFSDTVFLFHFLKLLKRSQDKQLFLCPN